MAARPPTPGASPAAAPGPAPGVAPAVVTPGAEAGAATWSRLYVTALLYPFVMGLPLYLCWLLQTGSGQTGLSIGYVLVAVILALLLWGAVWLVEWREQDQPEEHWQFITFAERLCRVGKLRGWDRTLTIGLVVACLLLLVLSLVSDAGVVLPPVVLLLLGSIANLSRPFVENPAEERRRARLHLVQEARQGRLRQARAEVKSGAVLRYAMRDVRVTEDLDDADLVLLNLTWQYEPYAGRERSVGAGAPPASTSYACDLLVRLDRYRELAARDHGVPASDLSRFREPPDAELRELADEIVLRAKQRGFARLDAAGLALALVQAIPYYDGSELPEDEKEVSYPVETLVDGRASPDGHAVLAAALFRALGFETLLVPIPDADPDRIDIPHLGVAIEAGPGIPRDRLLLYNGRGYFYVEPRDEPAVQLGELPAARVGQPLNPVRLP